MSKNFELSLQVQNHARNADGSIFSASNIVRESAEEREKRIRDLEERLRFNHEEQRRWTDDVYQLSASLERGVGNAIAGVGTLGHSAEVGARRMLGANDNVAPNALIRGGEHLMERAKSIEQNHISGMYREGLENSQPSGDITRPSTWSMGKNPNTADFLRNIVFSAVEDAPVYAAIAASMYATRNPTVATAFGTSRAIGASVAPPSAAIAGKIIPTAQTALQSIAPVATGAGSHAAQSAGGQASENIKRLDRYNNEELFQQSPVFRNRVEESMHSELPTAIKQAEAELGMELTAEEKAEIAVALFETTADNVREQLVSDIRTESGGLGAMSGLAGGALLGKVFGDAGVRATQSYIRQVGGKILATAKIEGLQEIGEGMGGRTGFNIATGMDVSLTEDTFAEFVMGVGSGGVAATPMALLTTQGRQRSKEEQQADTEARIRVTGDLGDVRNAVNQSESPSELRENFLNPEKKDTFAPTEVLRNVRQRLTSKDPETQLEASQLEEARELFSEAFVRAEGELTRRNEILTTFTATKNIDIQEAEQMVSNNEQQVAAMTDPVQKEAGLQAIAAQKQQLAIIKATRQFVEADGGAKAFEIKNYVMTAEIEGARPIEQQMVNTTIDATNIESLRKKVLDNAEQIKADIEANDLAGVVTFAMANPAAFESEESQAFLSDVLKHEKLDPKVAIAFENYRLLKQDIIERNKKDGSLARVRKDIIEGSKKNKQGQMFIGLKDYMRDIPRYFAAGKIEQAKAKHALLGKFALSHGKKAAALQDALEQVRTQGGKWHIAPIMDATGSHTNWIIQPGRMSKEDQAITGAINVNKNSGKLVDSVRQEAELIVRTHGILAAILNNEQVSSAEFTAAETELNEEGQKASEKVAQEQEENEAAVKRLNEQGVQDPTPADLTEPVRESEILITENSDGVFENTTVEQFTGEATNEREDAVLTRQEDGTTASSDTGAPGTITTAGTQSQKPAKVSPKEAAKRSWKVNTEKDNIVQAIAKLGGINREEAIGDGIVDPAFFTRAGRGNFPFRTPFTHKGRSFDEMVETLIGYGYLNSASGVITDDLVRDLKENLVAIIGDPDTAWDFMHPDGLEQQMLQREAEHRAEQEEMAAAHAQYEPTPAQETDSTNQESIPVAETTEEVNAEAVQPQEEAVNEPAQEETEVAETDVNETHPLVKTKADVNGVVTVINNTLKDVVAHSTKIKDKVVKAGQVIKGFVQGNITNSLLEETGLSTNLSDKEKQDLRTTARTIDALTKEHVNGVISRYVRREENKKSRQVFVIDQGISKILFTDPDFTKVNTDVANIISTHILGMISSMGYAGFRNNEESLAQLFNLDSSENVRWQLTQRFDKERADALFETTKTEFVIQDLGEAIQRDILSITKEAPEELQRLTAAHFGSIAFTVMDEMGYLQRRTQTFINTVDGVDENKRATFVSLTPLSREALDNIKEDFTTDQTTSLENYIRVALHNRNALETLANPVDNGRSIPTREPKKFQQKSIKNSDRLVPRNLSTILNKLQKKAHFIDPDVASTFSFMNDSTNMEENSLARLMGFTRAAEMRNLTKTNQKAAVEKNRSIEREIDQLEAAITEYGDGTPFYFERQVAKQQRVHYNNGFNPQENKVFRALISMEGWHETITGDNTQAHKNGFMLALAESFGVKTDSQSDATSIADAKVYLEGATQVLKGLREPQNDIESAVIELNKVLDEDGGLDPYSAGIDIDAIVAGVDEAGEAYHSYEGLLHLTRAARHIIENRSLDGFTHRLWREVDGKTNGPMLGIFNLASLPNIAEMLRAGGFYTSADGFTKLSDYMQKGGKDLYQLVATDLVRRLEAAVDQDILNSLYFFWGKLSDEGSVTSKGRNFAKPITTQVFYGAGVPKILEKMTKENFQESINDAIQKGVKNLRKAIDLDSVENIEQALVQLENVYTHLGNFISPASRGMFKRFGNDFRAVKENPSEENIKNLLDNFELRDSHIKAIEEGFSDVVKESLDELFVEFLGPYLDTTAVLNSAANVVYNLHNNAVEGAKKALLSKEVKAGNRASKGNRFGLRLSQIKEIDNIFRRMKPFAHTYLSKKENNPRAALPVGKRDTSLLMDYRNAKETVKILKRQGTKSIKNNTYQPLQAGWTQSVSSEPGVSLIIQMIHSMDVATSHINDIDSETDNLHVHDAKITGATSAAKMGRTFNKNTMEVLRDYSLAHEVLDMYKRTWQGFFEVYQQAQRENDTETMAQLRNSINETISKTMLDLGIRNSSKDVRMVKPSKFTEMLVNLEQTAKQTALAKLKHMRNVTHMDQYTINEGVYELNDADRAAIDALIEQIENQPSDERLFKQLEALEVAAFKGHRAVRKSDVPSKDKKAARKAFFENIDNQTREAKTEHDLRLLDRVLIANNSFKVSEVRSATAMAYREVKTVNDALNIINNASMENATNPALRVINTLLQKHVKSKKHFKDIPVVMLKQGNEGSVYDTLTNFGQSEDVIRQLIDGRKNAIYAINQKGEEIVVLKADGYLPPEHLRTETTVPHEFTTEQMLHEVWHAVSAGSIAEQLALPKEKRSKEFKQFEELYDFLNKSNISKQFPEAFANIFEFSAWGMTNPELAQRMSQIPESSIPASLKLNNTQWSVVKNMYHAFVQFFTNFVAGRNASNQEKTLLSTFLFHNILLAQSERNPEAVFKKNKAEIIHLSMNNVPPGAHSVMNMSSTQVFDALHNSMESNPSHSKKLRGLLENITERVLGRAGTLYTKAKDQTATRPEDVYIKSLETGKLPFASYAKGSKAIKLTDQEAFALDQVEAVFAGYLINAHGTYKNLEKMFYAAEKQLSAEDFYEGDWLTANSAERRRAKQLKDALFSRDAHPDSNFVARFGALALVHQPLNKALNKVTVRQSKAKTNTVMDHLENTWNIATELALGELDTSKKSAANTVRVEKMLQHLADTEASQKNYLLEQLSDTTQYIENALDTNLRTVDRLMTRGLDAAAQKTQGVRVIGSALGAASSWKALANDPTENTVGKTIHIAMDMRRRAKKNAHTKQNIVEASLSELRGGFDSMSRYSHKMIRRAKVIEHNRMQKQIAARKLLIEAFKDNGEYLSKEVKDSITKGLLKLDTQALLGEFSTQEIAQMFDNSIYLDTQTKQLEDQLQVFKNFDDRMVLIKDLAYYMATEKNVSEHLLQSAEEIAEMVGLRSEGTIKQDEIDTVVPIIDKLVSMYAIQYVDNQVKVNLRETFAQENARTDANGIDTVLRYHREGQRKTKLSEFSERYMPKGFTPEILNDKKSVVSATEEDGLKLIKQGYIKGSVVTTDSDDAINAGNKSAYVIRNGGLGRILSAALSYTNNYSNWQDTVRSGDIKADKKVIANMKRVKELRFSQLAKDGKSYDPTIRDEGKMIPTVRMNKGNKSTVSGYYYTLDRETKENILGRYNSFEDVLSKLETQAYDREASKKHNKEVIKGLREEFQTSMDQYGDYRSFIEVGPNSSDPSVKEMYDILPRETKQYIKEAWGSDTMYVRADVLDNILGYRKYSALSPLKKEAFDRNMTEQAFVNVVSAVFTDKAELRVAQAEEVLTDLVQHIKDMAVVKNLFTLVLNIKSNSSQLMLAGLSIKQSFALQREGLAYALAYRRDSAELEQLQQMDMLGIHSPERTKRIKEIESAIKNNKAARLIQEGLMPTVVESVDMVQDPFSYKGLVEEKVSKFVDKVPSPLRTVGKNLYMTHDTKLYKFMAGAAQLSDFTARYALYEYNTQLKKGPKLSHELALQDSSEVFINYDIPTHKAVQYMNDTGLLFYTKYYWRVQAILYRNLKEKPARAIGMAAAEHYFDNLGSVMGSGVHEIYGNPLHGSLLTYPGAASNIMTLKALGGILD